MTQLSEQEVKQLKKQGYTKTQIDQAVADFEEMERRRILQEEREFAMQEDEMMGRSSTFQYSPTDNLIKWQLELNDILERAEHILREDVVEIKEGNIFWKENPKKDKRIFNEYGVQEIMRVLSMYLNRNTILSDYNPEEISYKVLDFGQEVNDLIFMKYEEFGLDTLEKRKNYPMLVREIIDLVHSAYKRALYGGERDSLRTARSIQQQENILPPNINIQAGAEQRKERGIANPLRYIRGKYV